MSPTGRRARAGLAPASHLSALAPLLSSPLFVSAMEEPVSSSESIPPLPSLLPPRDHGPKRADVLSLKLRLAGLLPPDDGQQYWAGLVEFMTGKINREELGIVIKRVLGVSESVSRPASKHRK